MTDGRPPEWDGMDAPRALPPSLRARLEAALVAAASGVDASHPGLDALADDLFALDPVLDGELSVLASELDGPRPVPGRLRARLEAVLVAEGASSPHERRRRARAEAAGAELATATTRGQRWWVETRRARLAATAAALLLVMATTYFTSRTLSGQDGGPGATETAAGEPDPQGPPPPFGLPFVADAASATGGPDGPPAVTVTGAPLTVAVMGGDADQEAGFRAYVARLNEAGGVSGHRLVVVAAGTPEAAGAVATVNLSGQAVAGTAGVPALAGDGPLLETLAVPEKVLGHPVFAAASAPRRQAHLAVDAVFPSDSPGARAVVYQGDEGVWADEVPDALVEALAARGVSATRIPFGVGARPAFLPGDVAFLSLDTDGAAAWLAAARAARYAPPVTVVGLVSLFEPRLLGMLPEGTVIVSPYLARGAGGEAEELARRLGRQPGAAAVHGWVSAKALAVALWQTGADAPEEAAAALRGLDGWQEGFGPPWATRPGTTSRTPEGAVFTVAAGDFVLVEDFRADPF